MAFNNRGMALVSVVLILSVLLVLALILTEKVWRATRELGRAGLREQTFWAANAGIEQARLALANEYLASNGWQAYLQTATTGYPVTPAWALAFPPVSVQVYVRDNPDGDADRQQDNDLQVFVLSRATSAQGPEILIETLCTLDPAEVQRYASAENQESLADAPELPVLLGEAATEERME